MKLEIPELSALKLKNEKGVPVRKKLGVLIGTNRIIVEQMSLDWVEVADWDNDGDLDLSSQHEEAPMAVSKVGITFRAREKPGIRNASAPVESALASQRGPSRQARIRIATTAVCGSGI
jgi:hypothetical protein